MSDPTIWTATPALLAALGAFFVLAGLRQMRRARPVMGVVTATGGVALACLGLALGAVGVTFLSYARLTLERPAAEVRVLSLNSTDKRYSVIVTPTTGPATTCVLQGDEWILGAKVQTWKPWATTLGFDATYRLDQLANKYADAAEANGKPITACDLNAPTPALAPFLPARLLAFATEVLQAESRRFGSASYMPLADGAVYTVIMTQSGLAAEPANDVAKTAVAGR